MEDESKYNHFIATLNGLKADFLVIFVHASCLTQAFDQMACDVHTFAWCAFVHLSCVRCNALNTKNTWWLQYIPQAISDIKGGLQVIRKYEIS